MLLPGAPGWTGLWLDERGVGWVTDGDVSAATRLLFEVSHLTEHETP